MIRLIDDALIVCRMQAALKGLEDIDSSLDRADAYRLANVTAGLDSNNLEFCDREAARTERLRRGLCNAYAAADLLAPLDEIEDRLSNIARARRVLCRA